LHNPVLPQLAAPSSLHTPARSVPPAGIGEQVPTLPGTAHETQLALQAVLQHTPWAQIPLTHSAFPAHTAPAVFRPHDPAPQVAGATQSASAVHVDLQAPTPQVNGKQDVAAGTTHAPEPSQVPIGVSVVPLAGQLASRHGVPWP
jgi:hypothetical protein